MDGGHRFHRGREAVVPGNRGGLSGQRHDVGVGIGDAAQVGAGVETPTELHADAFVATLSLGATARFAHVERI